MAYSNESKLYPRAVIDGGADMTDQLKNETYLIPIPAPMTLLRLIVTVTSVADTDACVITFTRRVTPGSDTNAVAMGTVTLAATAAAGKVYYKDITPQNADSGDEIKIVSSNNGGSVKIQSTVEMIPRPEVAANQSDMVASA